MARLSKEEQARRDGFDYFVRLYRQQSIRIPEIEEEIQRRNIKGVPIGLDKKTEEEYCASIRQNALDTVLIMSEWGASQQDGIRKDQAEPVQGMV